MTLPALNACLNFTAAVLLVCGYLFIRCKQVQWHRCMMVAAFLVSCVFLYSYVYYHLHFGIKHYLGVGWHRTLYFSILFSHTVLAITIVPLILRTLYLALRERWESHRRWARWTLPLWFYVSVTGVIIYEMLY